MKKENYLIGTTIPFSPPEICSNAYGKTDECIRLMKNAGLNIVRNYGVYPFKDKSMTTLTDEYIEYKELVRRYAENGIATIGMMPNPGQMGTDGNGNIFYQWHHPNGINSIEDEDYFETLEYISEFVAKDMKDDITIWQVGNEQDGKPFIGDMTLEQNERWVITQARGIKKGNPDAKCTTCMSCGGGGGQPSFSGYTRHLSDVMLNSGYYDFMSIDGYFGSWSEGGPEEWERLVNETYEATKLPVLIMEWGYSTRQSGKPRTENELKTLKFNSPVCREKSWAPLGYSYKNLPHSEELQAEYIRETAAMFYEHPHVMGQLFFQWQDQPNCWQCGAPDCPAESAWGVVRADGTEKPGYFALKEMNEKYR